MGRHYGADGQRHPARALPSGRGRFDTGRSDTKRPRLLPIPPRYVQIVGRGQRDTRTVVPVAAGGGPAEADVRRLRTADRTLAPRHRGVGTRAIRSVVSSATTLPTMTREIAGEVV